MQHVHISMASAVVSLVEVVLLASAAKYALNRWGDAPPLRPMRDLFNYVF